MKKHFVLLSLLSLVLTGCGNKTIRFLNYNGEVLWEIPFYEGQAKTLYLGADPVRESDEMYDYSFKDWNHGLNDLSASLDYYAVYDKTLRTFKVNFYDYDSKLISSSDVLYGRNGYDYAPTNLIRENTNRIHYYFTGWSESDLSFVTKDMNVYAVYKEVPCYAVTYLDLNDKVLNIEYVEEGCSAGYTPENTDIVFSDNTIKSIVSWDKNLNNVTSDIVTKAIYETYNSYCVSFLDYDMSLISEVRIKEGYPAIYQGQNPTRAHEIYDSYIMNYKFIGWDKTISRVFSDEVIIAQYMEQCVARDKEYENAVNSIKTNAMNTTYDSDRGCYEKGFGLSVTIERIITGYGEYFPANDTTDLYFCILSYENEISSGGFVRIYFDKYVKGNYEVEFAYIYDKQEISRGRFNISSNFKDNDVITFYSGYNTSGFEEIASALVSTCLIAAKNTSWISPSNLGFLYI